ncbi:hypothetical protein CLV31_10320 [Algoriphagus aquaeductus]|uniref:Uncharacterized protein n=1 Tax=Algoriphagus aquaeductus TaxID=475299 RepID=A0A326RUW6_9BACT|nr:hypothetical protein CLV31_10320 [Algoriphagus aquaeductus]
MWKKNLLTILFHCAGIRLDFPNHDPTPALEFTYKFKIPGLKPWAIHDLTLPLPAFQGLELRQ